MAARLLFTRGMVGDVDTPLNSLWVARTSLVGEDPIYLGVTGAVWAEWAPDGRRLAYSTAERSGGVPGWKANNDLWLMTLPEEGLERRCPRSRGCCQPTAEIPYAWWGRSYAWSPDGQLLAYAQADEVGIVAMTDQVAGAPGHISLPFELRAIGPGCPVFPGPQTAICWPLRCHEGDSEGLNPEDSPIFGLWVTSTDGELLVRLAEEVGMWSAPRWSPAPTGLLAYGQAQSPRNSQDSRYDL